MESIIILVFVLGYLAITLEHNIKLDKLIPALVMMAVCWAIVALGVDSFSNWFDSSNHALVDNFANMVHDDKLHLVEETLLHHLGKTAEIQSLFRLLAIFPCAGQRSFGTLPLAFFFQLFVRPTRGG